MLKGKNILVIGGGISGITAAVEVAEVGHNITLVEKLPYLGGRVIRMNQYFPKLCPPLLRAGDQLQENQAKSTYKDIYFNNC